MIRRERFCSKEHKWNIAVCKTLMPPFPNMWRVGLTYDLALWPTDLAHGKSAWPLNLTFDLLIWISIGIIYLSWTIYLLSLKLVGQSIVELSGAQGKRDQHDLWPTDLNINRDHLLIKNHLPTNFEDPGAKCYWVISCTRLREINMTFDIELWPTDLNINRNHLLIKDYLPTKFEASGAKCYWVISCTRLRETDIPTDGQTDRRTDRHVQRNMPSFFKGGGGRGINMKALPCLVKKLWPRIPWLVKL